MKKPNKVEAELSRYLDGELDGRKADGVRARMEASSELKAEAEQFRAYGDLLRSEALPPGKPVDVAWSDVQRAIRVQEDVRGSDSILGSRLNWAAATMAMIFLGLGILLIQSRPVAVAVTPAEVEWVETDVPGAVTMVYQDDETGLTVIWMMEDDETEHDKLDT